ncbi:MAG TPA: ABC transporter permease [Thermoanaerobaculia bacterium]|nr:ABC transporter permease [Thermoanaerobaculia bacterium]
MFGNLGRDIRYAGRLLAKSPVFTAVAILSLALGIGANSVIFSVFNALLFQPLPAEKPEELVSVFTSDPSDPWGATSYPDYVDLRSGVGAFRELIAYTIARLRLETNGEAELVLGERVSGNYFTGLGAKPRLGRMFTAEDDVPGGPWVAVISERMWRRKFGADPGVLGKTLRLNGQSFTILGVAPEGFRDTLAGLSVNVWVPIVTSAGPLLSDLEQRGHRDLLLLGRLRPGSKIADAEAQMQALAARLKQNYPETNEDRGFQALSAEEAGVHPRIRNLLSVLGIFLTVVAGIVLIIACLNLANLLLAKAWGRQREVGIRLAIGATRKRLIRQLLVESFLLSLLGGAAGLLLTFWATALIRQFRPPEQIPISLDVGVDLRAIAFTLFLSLLTGFLFGLAPALTATRPDLNPTIKGGQSVPKRRRRRRLTLRNFLVVAQVAASIVLLVGAALFLRSLGQVEGIDPGFETRNVLLVSLDLREHDYDEERANPFIESVLERVRSLPGVRGASVAATVPLGFERKESMLQVPNQPGVEEQLSFNMVTPDYFRVMSIPLLRGRDFTPQDSRDQPRVAIVNEALAQRYWPGEEVVGKRVIASGTEYEIVGLVRTTKYRFLGETPVPYFYTPLFQDDSKVVNLHVKTAAEPLQLAGPVRRAIESADPSFQGLDVTTLEDQLAFALLPQRVGGVIFIVSGLLALGLACMGIYGVISYSVRQRLREMAIRMSLGAQARDILRLVLWESMSLVAVGIGLGLLVAFPIMTFVGSFLYGISSADPVSFLSVILLLTSAAFIATYVPARRATTVDPMITMRYD